MTKKKISALFSEEPHQWGLRGDPFLWKEIVQSIGGQPLPDTELQLSQLLDSTFERLVGCPISQLEDAYVERYAHGGMSSGHVSPEFWREKAFPMLLARYSGT
jgi:hypothetical protein